MGNVTFNITQPQKLNVRVEQKVIGLTVINKTEGITVLQNKINVTVQNIVVGVSVVQKDIKLTVSPMGVMGLQGVQGSQGYSAYIIAVQNGFLGTENEWLTSLQGNATTMKNAVLLANINGGYF